MINASDIIHLSPKAFWDVDMTTLDYSKQSDYIIRKVFEHGSWDDILEVTAYYGNEKILHTLTMASYLRGNTLFFASQFLNIPIQQFKCFTTKQYHPA
jgi:hypothetical protein